MSNILIQFLVCFLLCHSILHAQTIFFHESFDDANYNSRGWYDNSSLVVTTAEHALGSTACLEFHFLNGAKTGVGGSGIRRQFNPSDEVYLSIWVKYSANWTGSNKPYHPHQFHFTTTEDAQYVGPAWTHLTLYIEENEGRPLLAIQDGRNIDTSKINVDLSSTTESRSVAGCNGSSDIYPKGDCYRNGNTWYNGKVWKSPVVTFTQVPGPYYQNDWHHVEAYFKLNSIVNNKAIADGIARYWFDDSLLIDSPSIMMRTATFPDMKFNQFLILPYIGDGSPIDQTMWVDEVTVGSSKHMNTSVQESIDGIIYEPVTLKVYDILGNEIAVFEGDKSESNAWIARTITLISSGIYVMCVKSFNSTHTSLLCITK